MATVGSLVVQLLMNTNSFETDTKRAEAIAKKRADAIGAAFTDAGAKIGVAASVVGGSLVAMLASTAASAKEISNLAQISGAGAEEFQRFAAGAKSVGLEQDKLGDIFKDFREKVGEFAATGGGGMKDFFEQIAPRVGITAEAFRNLSGPQALQLYVSSLEKAGISQEEMSFYMESMASDTTALIPLLRSGGAEMKTLGEEAERTGRVMSAEAVESAKLLAKNVQDLQDNMVGARNQIAQQLIPTLNTLASEVLGVQNQTNGLATFLGSTLKTTLEATSVLALDVGFVFATVGDTIGAYIAVSDRLVRGDVAGAKAIGEAYREMSEQRRKALDDAQHRVLNPPRPVVFSPDDQSAAEARRLGLPVPGGKPWTRPNAKPPKEPKEKKEAYTDPLADSAKAYAATMEAINKAQLSAVMSGQELTATQSALVDLFGSSEFLAMPDTWKVAIADAGEYAIQAEKVADEQARLNALLTDSALEKQREDMALLAKALESGTITADKFSEAVHRALGTGGEEKGGYWEEWLKSAEGALGNFDTLAASVADTFSSRFGSAFEAVIFDSETMGDAVSGLAEGMLRAVVNSLGQMAAQWLAYQAVQMLVGKTTAATAATATALEAQSMSTMAGLNAFAATAAIPIVGPVMAPAAMAAALAVTAPMAATIAGLSAAAAGARASGGPVMGDTPYLVGERGAELFVPNTSGAIVPNHKLGGGGVTINVIENKQRAGQTDERNNNGAREVDVFVADIMGDGPRARAMKQAFGLSRRGY